MSLDASLKFTYMPSENESLKKKPKMKTKQKTQNFQQPHLKNKQAKQTKIPPKFWLRHQ